MGTIHWLHANGIQTTEETDKSPTGDHLREYVEGYIEIVRILFEGRPEMMIVNDEGAIRGLPKNEAATQAYHENIKRQCTERGIEYFYDAYPKIYGNAVILQGKEVHLD